MRPTRLGVLATGVGGFAVLFVTAAFALPRFATAFHP